MYFLKICSILCLSKQDSYLSHIISHDEQCHHTTIQITSKNSFIEITGTIHVANLCFRYVPLFRIFILFGLWFCEIDLYGQYEDPVFPKPGNRSFALPFLVYRTAAQWNWPKIFHVYLYNRSSVTPRCAFKDQELHVVHAWRRQFTTTCTRLGCEPIYIERI